MYSAPIFHRHSYNLRDNAGGAMSLGVVIIIPVMISMAALAHAIPRYLLAQQTAATAAGDLAIAAAIYREGTPAGELAQFPASCAQTDPPSPKSCATLWDEMLADLGAGGMTGDVSGYYTDTARHIAQTPGAIPPCPDLGVDGSAVQVALTTEWGADDWATAQTLLGSVELGATRIADPHSVDSLRDPARFGLEQCQAIYDVDPAEARTFATRQFWGQAERTYFK